jgi:hypothetical protein
MWVWKQTSAIFPSIIFIHQLSPMFFSLTNLNFFHHKIGGFWEISSPSVNSNKFSFLVKFCQIFNIARGEKNVGHNKFPITNMFGYWIIFQEMGT